MAVAGCLVAVLGADYLLGMTAQAVVPDRSAPAEPVIVDGAGDRLASSPAMAGAGWAEAHFEALAQMPSRYWSFTERKPEPFAGGGITVTGWDRRTLRRPAGSGPRPEVWVLGGSLAFGVGQRDDHTVASELVRLADRDGLPVAVRNLGRPGWVHFQEAILYEQLLAEGPAPDLALFVDGAADIEAQGVFSAAVPALVDTQDYAVAIGGTRIQTGTAAPPPPGLGEELWTTYRDHSLVLDLLGRSGLGPAPGDGGAPEVRPAPDASDPFGSPDAGRRAVEVYERGRRLTDALGERYGVDTRWYWQPMDGGLPAVAAARAALPETSSDLHGVLDDHPEVFIDGVDVNEAGARRIAAALWRDIRPSVARWHRDHGG